MNLVTGSSVVLVTAFLLAYQMRENKLRDAGERDDRLDRSDVDLLGNEHPEFR